MNLLRIDLWKKFQDRALRVVRHRDDGARCLDGVLEDFSIASVFHFVHKRVSSRGLCRARFLKQDQIVNGDDKWCSDSEWHVPVGEVNEIQMCSVHDPRKHDLLLERVPMNVHLSSLESIVFPSYLLILNKQNVAVFMVNALKPVYKLFNVPSKTATPSLWAIHPSINANLHSYWSHANYEYVRIYELEAFIYFRFVYSYIFVIRVRPIS